MTPYNPNLTYPTKDSVVLYSDKVLYMRIVAIVEVKE